MNKKSSSEMLEKIKNNKIQILIGTQLISKGFHFPNLNCIIVVDLDLTLQGYDLRSAAFNATVRLLTPPSFNNNGNDLSNNPDVYTDHLIP